MSTTQLPLVPEPVALAMRWLPLAPLALGLRRLGRAIAHHHPGLMDRLGTHRTAVFVIDPADLPIVFRLDASGPVPVVEPLRRTAGTPHDARIAGPLAALLGMIHGAFDGDALFFSGELVIEGDTEAVLALRNALDDAELDLADELARAAGPLGSVLDALRPHLLPRAEQFTGLVLTRTA